MAAERIDVSSIVDILAQIVRLHEGNRTPEINALLERADEARAAVAELIEADKEYDAAEKHAAQQVTADGISGEWVRSLERVGLAHQRRATALARMQGEGA